MMKNEAPHTMPEQEAPAEKSSIWQRAWRVVSNNWGWKVISFVLAVCLWGVLISQDSSLPRDKVIENVRVNVTNATALRNNGFIVISGLEDAQSVRIRARVPQRNYSAASAENYTARLDLSQIQDTGEQTLRITASASNSSLYGSVQEVYEPEVTLLVEEYSTAANVPVEVHYTGEMSGNYFASSLTRSVEAVDISGPKSVVEQVARCVVDYDQSALSPEKSPNAVSLPFVLMDAQGNVLDQSNLTVTGRGQTTAIQRITVSQDVYYLAQVGVDMEALVKGEPAEGYAVSGIRVTPQTITLAGSEVALANYLQEGALLYPFDQVDISGQNRTVSQVLYLNTPGNVEYISTNAVQVVVSILPEEFVNVASGTENNP